MKQKIKYTLKFLLGLIFIAGISYLAYWLIFIYKIENIFLLGLLGFFFVIPLLMTLLSLPGEFIILLLVWTSDVPDEVEDVAAYLRERGKL